MTEVNINEIAIIFKRVKYDFELLEEFVPYKVVEGYYYEEESCFIDTEQNVYSHMASLSEIGNVYAARKNIAELLKEYENLTLKEIKERIIKHFKGLEIYKSVNEDDDEYNIIKMKNKQTKKVIIFNDKDTKIYYEMYQELRSYNPPKNNPVPKEEPTIQVPLLNKNTKGIDKTPIEIIDEIKKTIKGQDAAIETIVTSIWMKYKFTDIPKTNMLLIGPSGVGKTAIFKKIKKILDVPISIYSVTGTSQAGYKGHDIEEMLVGLYYDSGENLEKAENGIVFIDEFDKIANNRDTGEVGTVAVQNELLKLIEGTERIVELGNHKTIKINTENILFVCCGAFSELYEVKKEKSIGFSNQLERELPRQKITTEKIINYGIIRELAGRLPIIIELNDLNKEKEVLKEILLNSDESIFLKLINVLNSEGIIIENLNEVIDMIIDDAINRKIGARGLANPSRNLFLKIFYEIGNNPGKYDRVILGRNIMNDNSDFELIKKHTKKRIKTETTY